jgi:phytoene dehydrogenase-like protein
MSSAWYNVIVIGGDLSALIYAVMAGKAGYRVGVVGQRDKPNSYRHEGHVFLRQPERFFGFTTSPVVARVLTDLSLNLEMKNRPQALDPTLQIVTDDMRLDVLGNGKLWRRELEREVPGLVHGVLAFEDWASEQTRRSNEALTADVVYPPEGLRAGARYRAATQSCGDLLETPEARRPPLLAALGRLAPLLEAPLTHLAGVQTNPLGPLPLARLWTHLRAGLYRLPDGLDGLKQIFVRKLLDQCCDYRPDNVVETIVFQRGKAREVLLADRHEALGCEMVVCGTDPGHFLSLIPAHERIARYHADLTAQLEPQAYRVVLNFAVDPRVIPRGMGAEVLLADPTRPLLAEGCLWISRPGAGPYAAGDSRPGPGVLMVTALLPARGATPSVTSVQRLVSAVRARLRRLIPWFDDHLQAVHVPCLRPMGRGGEAGVDPTELIPVMQAPHPMTLGVSAAPTATAYRNVLLSGNTPFSGLGFEGAFLGALQALAVTRRTLKLRSQLA